MQYLGPVLEEPFPLGLKWQEAASGRTVVLANVAEDFFGNRRATLPSRCTVFSLIGHVSPNRSYLAADDYFRKMEAPAGLPSTGVQLRTVLEPIMGTFFSNTKSPQVDIRSHTLSSESAESLMFCSSDV
ncbi:hypothetical protein ACG7TL_006720 [Trametes sanguinea]